MIQTELQLVDGQWVKRTTKRKYNYHTGCYDELVTVEPFDMAKTVVNLKRFVPGGQNEPKPD